MGQSLKAQGILRYGTEATGKVRYTYIYERSRLPVTKSPGPADLIGSLFM
jgi:hypothetical protein